MERARIPPLVLCSTKLSACNPRARTVYDEIMPQFKREYPGATVLNAVPDTHPSLTGVLGYAVDLTITFKRSRRAVEERVMWYSSDHKDQGWIVKEKRPL